MASTTTTKEGTARASRAAQETAPLFSGSLDDLLALDATELERLYRAARVPNLADVSGPLRGRMLAIPQMPLALRGAVRAFAGSDAFPWRGKTFRPRDATAGEGINRVVSNSFELYRFETSVGRSRAGDFDAVQLDYDLPENPFFIRAIKDEIREIAPGLWLGQAYAELRGTPHLVLYFALANR
jgi:hypothetical protein